ncbi:V-type immunoglobulin domain-containing suppressor of T-cell activation [Rousettus aegyptiacus]|uniref:V-set immunoregulatory receptor n=1 Tax=Rousettus aegyptiacus TaxID=9407 RepID=A0A7J8GJE2_ROUAE|nr:V-type immunoglobulin domain-containing suppressor of T-cell activation [Rousettus aegyptiacus]KAF6459699.1 V-set immunoregulatory receptor [Rousettus aegyptiacus]
MGVPPVPEANNGLRWGPVLLTVFLIASRGLVAAFKVAIPYSLYVCPEGQNVTLTCRILGPVAKGQHDVTFYKTWYRSSRGEMQACLDHRPIRNVTSQDLRLHHGSHQTANTNEDRARQHGLESISDHHGNFSIIMLNLTPSDSGLYCCLVVEIRHHHWEQRVHGAIELQVQRGNETSKCIAYPPSTKESENITAAALATGACIVGILCLPLILLLVYKQRQVASNRRAQELVRMDSNAQGIENPGFEGSPPSQGMPEAKPRLPLSYVAQRQPSESGRHLLSEPSTPLSPPGLGDVFFPSLDPVPDSPNCETI